LADSTAHIFGDTGVAIFFVPKLIDLRNIVPVLSDCTFLIVRVSSAWDRIFLIFNWIFDWWVFIGLDRILFLWRFYLLKILILMD